MSNVLRALVAIATLAGSCAASAECAYPKAPQEIPDGKTASEAAMIAAMAAFKQYNGDVTSYTACLEKETADKVREAAGSGIVMHIKSLQEKKHNTVVSELKEKANAFNEQVRLFKARK